jgi:hypothetical protein
MANGNSDGTIYLSTKYPPSYWGITATLSQIATVTITAGTSTSTALDFTSDTLRGYCPLAVFSPSGWTSAIIAIDTSFDGTNWYPLHQCLNGAYDTANAVNSTQCHTFDGHPLNGMPYVRFISGTHASRVNQVSTSVLTILCGTI